MWQLWQHGSFCQEVWHSQVWQEDQEARETCNVWGLLILWFWVHRHDQRCRLTQRILLVQGKPVSFLLDTGASTSLLPAKCIYISRLNLGPTKILEVWNGTSERSCGTASLPVSNSATNKRCKIRFDVVSGDYRPVLGLAGVLRLDLMEISLDNIGRVLSVKQSKQTTKNAILEQYPHVFANILGTLPGEAHLSVDASMQPVVLPPRTIPVPLRKPVQTELKRLQDLKVIPPSEGPTDWVSQMVAVDKNNSELCLHMYRSKTPKQSLAARALSPAYAGRNPARTEQGKSVLQMWSSLWLLTCSPWCRITEAYLHPVTVWKLCLEPTPIWPDCL